MNIPDLTKPNVSPMTPLAVGEREAARLLGVSTRTLFNWRVDGRGPRFVRIGARILYGTDELRRWLDNAAQAGQLPAVQAVGVPVAAEGGAA